MELIETKLSDMKVFKLAMYKDDRGFFMETFNADHYRQYGVDKVFVQDNYSRSAKGVIRGMHYQLPKPQGKLIHVTAGEILDIAVDIRVGSPTFGQWASVVMSAENQLQVYIPEGFAHGFHVLSDTADVMYKCTNVYSPGDDRGILWNDDEVGIVWELTDDVVVSDKDKVNPRLSQVPVNQLPVY
ncbi:MAG: dTDP-4-dehydrorhamnose 3,5-epimerase [Phycisphaerae bacterium]|nr:dTDP-4-dehydrorhamnose 3,5-epimerase [Phycisphaerae bacterium]